MVGDEAGNCIMEGFIDHATDLSFISVDLGELLKLFFILGSYMVRFVTLNKCLQMYS